MLHQSLGSVSRELLHTRVAMLGARACKQSLEYWCWGEGRCGCWWRHTYQGTTSGCRAPRSPPVTLHCCTVWRISACAVLSWLSQRMLTRPYPVPLWMGWQSVRLGSQLDSWRPGVVWYQLRHQLPTSRRDRGSVQPDSGAGTRSHDGCRASCTSARGTSPFRRGIQSIVTAAILFGSLCSVCVCVFVCGWVCGCVGCRAAVLQFRAQPAISGVCHSVV
jgi:hypothetical protein